MSNNTKNVLCEIDSKGCAHLILNRIDKHNAFNAEMIQELLEAVDKLKSADIRLVWMRSNAKHFCTGADLNWMQQSTHFSEAENIEDAMQLGRLMYEWYHFPKPTLCTINGACYGGGIGLAACSKITIASDDAQFCFSEAKLGLIPAVISPYILQALGARVSEAYFLSTEVFSAQQAKQFGLLYDVVKREQLDTRGQEIVDRILLSSPQALSQIHTLLNHVKSNPIDQNLMVHTAQMIASIRSSKEGQEGLQAFLEKRQPNWMIKS